MNKADLIDAIAAKAGISKKAAADALDAVTESITKALKKGESVALIGFGTFSVAKRNARMGINPATGEKIKIKAKRVAKFKAGAALAKAVA
ncbi:MAG: HU family DNA-binding protein [bacterium]|nr:HU family DNA-binding protein [bacterium]